MYNLAYAVVPSRNFIPSHRLMLPSIEQQLKASVPRCAPPADLHNSIMLALRSARTEPPLGKTVRLGWAAAAASSLALLTLVGVLLATREGAPRLEPATNEPALGVADTALSVGDQLSRSAPAAIVAPMERELAFIDRDLESARQVLLASLP